MGAELSLSPSILSITSGSLSLCVAADLAGRVTQLSYQGHQLLATPEAHPTNWGATYWTSPQSDWGWPPVPEVDHLPFEVVEAGTALTLRGPLARIAERAFVVEKKFAPGPLGTIDATYTIENQGKKPFSMANWEISRVPGGGLTFFPTGATELTPIAPHSSLRLHHAFETSFYDHAEFSGTQSLKVHADGTGGYLAHVAGGLLLLKLFEDTLPQDQAPGEGECEIFANEDGRYVEIEVQGAYREIPPGGRHSTRIRTVVSPLPVAVDRADLKALRDLADELAARMSALPALDA